jgi:HK97 family phage major capsid protein
VAGQQTGGRGVTPRISGPVRYSRERSLTSLEEYRAAAEESDDGYNRAGDEQSLFWRYVLSPGIPVNQLFSEAEYRVLNKTSGSAGGFVVPTEMEPKVVSAARAASAVAQLALELQTESGDTWLLPTRTIDAAAVWTAESAGYTLGDLTFGQTSLSAFKSATLVKATEELAQDAGVPFDDYLAVELGGRLGDLQGGGFLPRHRPRPATRNRPRLQPVHGHDRCDWLESALQSGRHPGFL